MPLLLTSLPAEEAGVAAAVRAAEIPDADTPPSKRPRRLLPADEPLPPDLQKLVDNCEDISPAERAQVAALLPNMDGAHPAEVRVTYCWVNPDGTCGTSVESTPQLPELTHKAEITTVVICQRYHGKENS
ncbi:Ribonuclease HII [Frankliniella fusca]|uniref:Ribonuclease HII n=1 Tax=Frankliniella fusca TaxID=407009 RepID=A0AAE1L775_9NEOP|nr:Ribonuclease HII [Frankliniella fusca]